MSCCGVGEMRRPDLLEADRRDRRFGHLKKREVDQRDQRYKGAVKNKTRSGMKRGAGFDMLR